MATLAIHAAAASGDLVAVESELNSRADLCGALDEVGGTPLHLAATAGHEDVVLLLLARGGDCGAKDSEGWTPLHEAAKAGHLAVVVQLLDHGADIGSVGPGGARPLHICAANGFAGLCALLLERGADLEAADSTGATPLLHAAFGGNLEVIDVLVSTGADLDAQGKDGRTVLHYAAYSGDPAVSEFLSERGAKSIEAAQRWAYPSINLLGFPDYFQGADPNVEEHPPPQGFSRHTSHAYGCGATVHFFHIQDAGMLNEALVAAALRMEAGATPGLNVSNQGGYHSSGSLFDNCAAPACVSKLAALLSSATGALTRGGDAGAMGDSVARVPSAPPSWSSLRAVHSWVNVNRRQHFNKLHDHVPSEPVKLLLWRPFVRECMESDQRL